MGGVRVLVGTRKGAFVLSSDERRESWEVAGPHPSDAGDTWSAIVHDLPAVLSVEVQTLS